MTTVPTHEGHAYPKPHMAGKESFRGTHGGKAICEFPTIKGTQFLETASLREAFFRSFHCVVHKDGGSPSGPA